MTSSVLIFGFGSAFAGVDDPNDVDLLVLHKSNTIEGCQLSLKCKAKLEVISERIHITMLSESEESQFQFILKSRAKILGQVSERNLNADLALIIAALPKV